MKKLLAFFKNRRSIARRSELAEKKFQRWLKEHEPLHTAGKIALQKCYTDKEGNNFYFLPDPLQMTKERADLLNEAITASEYNVEKDVLADAFDKSHQDAKKIRELIKNRKYKQADGILDSIENKSADMSYRIRQIGTIETIINIALVFFYIDGENPYTVNELTMKKKREMIEADDDLRAFFLRTTWDLFRASTGIASGDFLNFIKETTIKKRKSGTNFSS